MEELFANIPVPSHSYVKELLKHLPLLFRLTQKRLSKHGDYRRRLDGVHEISLNVTENPYRFLITLIHEIAHYIAFEKYGFRIKPHGNEWKSTYKQLMFPLLHPLVFPEDLLSKLALHFKNPKAATDTDFELVRVLNRYDSDPEKTYIFELTEGDSFVLENGKKFIRGPKRRKLFECVEISTSKHYLISPHAVIKRISNK